MTTRRRRPGRRPTAAAGPRNRLVELQRQTTTRDSFGGVVTGWTKLADLWASVNQTGVSTAFENDAKRDVALRTARFRIDWRAGLRETDRLIYGGLIWDIKGIAEIGRRRALELICQTDVDRLA